MKKFEQGEDLYISKSPRFAISAFILFLVSLTLCLVWYDWRLFIILMLFGWGMNLENKGKKL